MDSNTFIFFGGIIFLLLAYGSLARVRLFSLVGAALLLIMGLFMITSGVELNTGETTATSTNTTVIDENTTISQANSTTLFTYATPPQISVFSWDSLFSLSFILVGLGGLYIFTVDEQWGG